MTLQRILQTQGKEPFYKAVKSKMTSGEATDAVIKEVWDAALDEAAAKAELTVCGEYFDKTCVDRDSILNLKKLLE